MNLYVELDRTVVVDNVTYHPGSKVPLAAAVKEGVVTDAQVQAAVTPKGKASQPNPGGVPNPKKQAAADGRAKIRPKKASAPDVETRERTPRHVTR